MEQNNIAKSNPPAKLDPIKKSIEYSVDPDWDELKHGELDILGRHFNAKESYY